MTAEQLKAYAAENDLDLGGATKKADIMAAIQKAETG
jgi:flagellar hook-basal body complex protein FliE